MNNHGKLILSFIWPCFGLKHTIIYKSVFLKETFLVYTYICIRVCVCIYTYTHKYTQTFLYVYTQCLFGVLRQRNTEIQFRRVIVELNGNSLVIKFGKPIHYYSFWRVESGVFV